ncbi:MAG: hypothetical protein LBE27_07355, partial [Deltaproteobacteria bacterium]|nr:hypothetical protein [Deltaproteobacteria bacterium]
TRQAAEIEENFQRLRERDEKIKDLESQGDTLALLYWSVVKLALTEIQPAALPGGSPQGNSSGGEGSTPSAKGGAGSGKLATGETVKTGFGLSAIILRQVRKAARKTLFSLILGGGIMLFALPASANAPEGGVFSPFSRQEFRGVTKPMLESREGLVRVIETRMFSKTLRRTVDLGFLSTADRALKDSDRELRCRDRLLSQAQSHGLSLEEWAALIRGGWRVEETVYLSDLESPKILGRLISPKLPELSKALPEALKLIPEKAWTMALQNIAAMRPPEGLFWERVYLELLKSLGDKFLAGEGALLRLSRKSSMALERLEFGGALTPLRDLEELTPEAAVSFLAGYIKSWRSGKKYPKGTAPQWLATDLWNASRVFRLPFTFLSVITHQHYECEGIIPNALEVYAGSRGLVTLINLVKRTWNPQRPPICDLEEAARLFPVSLREPRVFQRKYQDLINSFRKENAKGGALFDHV